jgi:hypothetical protein
MDTALGDTAKVNGSWLNYSIGTGSEIRNCYIDPYWPPAPDKFTPATSINTFWYSSPEDKGKKAITLANKLMESKFVKINTPKQLMELIELLMGD